MVNLRRIALYGSMLLVAIVLAVATNGDWRDLVYRAKATVATATAEVYPNCPKTHILDFGASWCGPCMTAKPFFESLKKEGWDCLYYDNDDPKNSGVYEDYKVKSLPTFIVITDDSPNKVLFRTTSVFELKQWLAKNKPPK